MEAVVIAQHGSMSRRRWALRGGLVLAGLAGLLAAYHYGSGLANVSVPVAKAREANLVISIEARGAVQDTQPVVIMAPEGTRPVIAAIAAPDAKVHKGDVVVEFEDEGLRRGASPTMRAPVDGVVRVLPNPERAAGAGKVVFEPGDAVFPGMPILQIDQGLGPSVVLGLDDVDRAQVSVNQTATVRADAIAGRTFAGRVKSVSAFAGPDQRFAVRVSIEESDPRLRPGMLVSVAIAVRTVPRQLLIPARAVFASDGEPVVYLQHGHEFEPHAIVPGLRNDVDVAVVRGLRAGDAVALEDPTDKVRSR
jgi:multidrug efflux pump subunit AcrA (membrane-fusion protein)